MKNPTHDPRSPLARALTRRQLFSRGAGGLGSVALASLLGREAAAAPGTAFETAAARSLRNQSGVEITGVTCPDRIDLETGNEVRCTAFDIENNERELVLTLTDEEGGFDVRLLPLDATPQDSKN